MDKYEYPNENEIVDFFDQFMGYNNLRLFFIQHGIAFASDKSSEIAKYGSKIIFGYNDFSQMKLTTTTVQKYKKISGFLLNTTKSIEEIRDSFNGGMLIDERNNLKINDVSYYSKNNSLSVSYSFDKRSPGKMKFIDTEERKGDFQIIFDSQKNR